MSFLLTKSSLTEKFRRDEKGTIAIIFALSLLPVLMLVGGALDVSRMYAYRGRLQSLADQALDSALQGDLSTSVATRIAAARNTFEAFAPSNGLSQGIVDPDFDIRVQDRIVRAKITLKSNFELAFGKLFHIPTVEIAASASTEKDFVSIDQRILLCHIGKQDDIKRLNCGHY